MASRIDYLISRNLATPPKHIQGSIHYEVITGSMAYGVNENSSDMDVYSWSLPPKEYIFPHLAGEIIGFDEPKYRFDVYQQHHIVDPSNGNEYDISVYNIIKYFRLCMENNPNMLDTLYVPMNCILHCSPLGQMVRDKRDIFIHKGCWHKFKGYSYSQLHKLDVKHSIAREMFLFEQKYMENGQLVKPVPIQDLNHYENLCSQFPQELEKSKRNELVRKYGYDTKFAYHVVRLMDEVEQLLTSGTMELGRNREELKAIRRGEWTLEDIKNRFTRDEETLNQLYKDSKLPHGPNTQAIKQLLMDVIEHHYGSISQALTVETDAASLISEMEQLIRKYK